MSAASSAAYGASVARQTRAVDRIHPHLAVGYAVLALWVVAPLAVGFAVVATRLAHTGDEFAVALGTTVVFGLLGGLVLTAILRRRAVVLRPSDRPARDRPHGP
jgi:ABC-type Na+ efflux pump permease subunit